MSAETDAVVDLWRLQSRYADIITRCAWPELREVFRPDTTVHVDTVTAAPRTMVGPDELGNFVAAAIERYDSFNFVILNAVVDVDAPDRAHGRMFICEIRHDRESDTWPNSFGVYEDQYVKADGRWWFAERHYRSIARAGPDNQILGLPPGLGPVGH
jgi:SnoaL-like domain